MGQEHSVPAPRRVPNRLSKPKTNTTGNMISKLPGPPSRQGSQSNNSSPVNTRHSFWYNEAVVGEAQKPKPEKQRKRMSLFRSKSSQAKQQNLTVDIGIEREFVDPSPVEKPVPARRHSKSRPSSVATIEEHSHEFYSSRPPNYSRMSLQNLPYQQHQTRLPFVAEARSPRLLEQDPEQEPLSRYEDSEPQRVLPRANSDTTLYGPIRRRSLLQHGVATRKSPFPESDSRQSLPSQVYASEIQDYYYNPGKSPSSPLSNIAGLGREVNNGSPLPRVETPTDMDYGHTGIFKLGSLRITNGAVSPALSEVRTSTPADEDFLTVGARRSAERYHQQHPSQRGNTMATPIDITRPWTTQAESALRQPYEAEQPPLMIETRLPLPDPSFALFNFGNKHSPNRSLDLANEYMNDLALSPFSFEASPPASPKLQATSKHMAVDDELFEAEPVSPGEHPPSSFDSGYGTTESTQAHVAPKPLAKADSGYSSNISLRSFKKDAATIVRESDGLPTPSTGAVPRAASSTYSSEAPSRVASSVYSIPSQASDMTLRAERSLPAIPPQEVSVPQPLRDPPSVPMISGETGTPKPADKQLRRQSLPSLPKTVQQPPVLREKSSSSGESISSNGSKWRSNRIQKQRSKTVEPTPVFTIQAIRASGVYGIPAVPAETSRKLDERVDGFPTTSIPNTFSGASNLRRSGSKETLTTIFSVGSAEVRDELSFARLQAALPSVPTHGPIPEYAPTSPEQKPAFERRATYQPTSYKPIPQRKPLENRRSLPATARDRMHAQRRQSIEQQEEEFEAHVTNFDTISSSLGKSPYDVAANAIRRPQSSGASVSARLTISQLELDAAARFQQARSVSRESSTLVSRKSLDSIAVGNPLASSTNTTSHLRRKSREHPPQAHANTSGKRPYSFIPPPSYPLPPLPRELKKTKSPPPISMKTQRKSLPAMPAPPMAAPDRTPPQPPVTFKSHSWVNPVQTQATEENSWAKHLNYWAERRESAGEQLSRSRPGSARPSIDFERPVQNLRTYTSFDQSMRSQWEADHAQHGTYSSTYPQPPPQLQPTEDEYYGQEDDTGSSSLDLTMAKNHARSGSTDEMIVLDRYTGGLGYGFEGRGIIGSAGNRNSGTLLGGGGASRKGEKVARDWGVDLSDVPVFLQRVRVES